MYAQTKQKAKKAAKELPFFTVGEIKAVYLPKSQPEAIILSSQSAAEFFKKIWEDGQIALRESLYAMFLNRANKVIAWRQLTNGGTSGTVADPKILFQHALLANASSIIVAHNHPSGSIKPSAADKDMTEKFKKCGLFLDLTILDHIIITPGEAYYSFADEGNL